MLPANPMLLLAEEQVGTNHMLAALWSAGKRRGVRGLCGQGPQPGGLPGPPARRPG